ncbi:MAG: GntR family transcriptional regulator [Ectothiorhodospiraceae bacterium]|nr:GntR family transcriptional regulator [Chromatiales bacterium]MCP5154541.1 GntR family transcriptional regulator [Ectothiorhodospiraceae bacterium]
MNHPRDLPLYRVVERHLRDRIDSGELVAGDLVPSEPQLARALGVSQGTVKKAIDNLVKERRLYRHQGKGTYVSRIDFDNSLFRFFAYGDRQGDAVRIHKKTPLRRIRRGPREVCQRLGQPDGAELLYIERVGYVESTPILIERSWWIASLVGGLEREDVHIPDLMYAMVEERFALPVVRCDETLTAEAADASTARRLTIAPGAPLVVLKRLTYTTEERAIEYRLTRGRADRFSYKTQIR